MVHILLRAVWFVFVGWWAGPLWFLGSLALMVSVLFFPLGAYTVTKTWTITTLSGNPRKVVIEAQERAD